jgi:hypothetical protein
MDEFGLLLSLFSIHPIIFQPYYFCSFPIIFLEPNPYFYSFFPSPSFPHVSDQKSPFRHFLRMGNSASRAASLLKHPSPKSHRIKMDRYLVGDVLARTPHSINFTAIDTGSQNCVALKVLNPPSCDFEQSLIENEISIMRRIKHPNLLPLLEVLEVTGRKVIVTPLAAGTLNDLIRPDYQNSEVYVREVIKQILTALDFLHTLSIVHRDVKPANIYIMNKERPAVVLADFGFAADLNKEFKHEFVGSSAFVAPEVYAGKNCMFYIPIKVLIGFL